MSRRKERRDQRRAKPTVISVWPSDVGQAEDYEISLEVDQYDGHLQCVEVTTATGDLVYVFADGRVYSPSWDRLY